MHGFDLFIYGRQFALSNKGSIRDSPLLFHLLANKPLAFETVWLKKCLVHTVVSREVSMHTPLQDLHYALRQLRKAPGFALTAVLTLAVGIGGVTAVFSVVEAVMLRPLPFKDSGRLISLHESFEQRFARTAYVRTGCADLPAREQGFLRRWAASSDRLTN